jgi:hypothetical protein
MVTVRPGGLDSMNSISWGHGWQAVQIGPWWIDHNAAPAPGQPYLWTAATVSSQAQARALIDDAGFQVPALRAALEQGSTDLARMNDDQIIDHLASLIADGQCLLLSKALTPEAALLPVQNGPRVKPEAGGQAGAASVKSVITPAFAMPQRGAAAAGAPAKTSAAPEEAPVSDFASVDQDKQAAALQQAAAAGVPFCEVCEKAARQAAQAA